MGGSFSKWQGEENWKVSTSCVERKITVSKCK